MQVFHIEFYVFKFLLLQHCNMFQTHIFGEICNQILMQCSHSRHANIIQTQRYNCYKAKFVCIDVNILSF
jgi:hypothetical protein